MSSNSDSSTTDGYSPRPNEETSASPSTPTTPAAANNSSEGTPRSDDSESDLCSSVSEPCVEKGCPVHDPAYYDSDPDYDDGVIDLDSVVKGGCSTCGKEGHATVECPTTNDKEDPMMMMSGAVQQQEGEEEEK